MRVLKKHMESIKNIVGCVLFLTITVSVVSSVTYLFRENLYTERLSIAGIKEEKENSLDVIYVGGSAAMVYWEPLKAYGDYGFTSYNLVANGIQLESIFSYIKYAQKYQSPRLYIVDARAFPYCDDVGYEVRLRNSSDQLDIGYDRVALINDYLANRTMEDDVDKPALYFDLAKYHTNYKILSEPNAWKLIDNSITCESKGNALVTEWCYLDKPQNFKTNKRVELIPQNKKILIRLLEYCKKNNLNIFFVVSPYKTNQDDYSMYNTIDDIVSSYGYNFLNSNDYYNEMNIDFARDFYDESHVNACGSEKYTEFLEKYLVQNYDLPDHRNDSRYSEWNDLANDFDVSIDEHKKYIQENINAADEAITIGKTIRETDDFYVWGNLINDYRYTIAAVGNTSFFTDLNYLDKKLLEANDMMEMIGKDVCICISRSNTETNKYTNLDNQEKSIEVDIRQNGKWVFYTITSQQNSIVIDDVEYSMKNNDGLNVVIVDNYYRTIVDSVTLIKGANGKINLLRTSID